MGVPLTTPMSLPPLWPPRRHTGGRPDGGAVLGVGGRHGAGVEAGLPGLHRGAGGAQRCAIGPTRFSDTLPLRVGGDEVWDPTKPTLHPGRLLAATTAFWALILMKYPSPAVRPVVRQPIDPHGGNKWWKTPQKPQIVYSDIFYESTQTHAKRT